jgi:hypothetical protein
MFTLGVPDFDAQRGIYRRLERPLALDAGDFPVFELRGGTRAWSSPTLIEETFARRLVARCDPELSPTRGSLCK